MSLSSLFGQFKPSLLNKSINFYNLFSKINEIIIILTKLLNGTGLFISLHWLPVVARIKSKTVMLAYRTTTGSAPSYFHSLLRIYIPSRSLRYASERCLEAQNHSPEHSLSPFLAGGMIFPSPSGILDSCQSSSNNWKLISFNTTWLQYKQI